eukprot:scaffold49878_cov40-Tisochrysis_lutea.AAC.1
MSGWAAGTCLLGCSPVRGAPIQPNSPSTSSSAPECMGRPRDQPSPHRPSLAHAPGSLTAQDGDGEDGESRQ